jgi:aspartyl aminopeptidase
MKTQTANNYEQIQQQVQNLNEIELAEVIDFISFLQQKKTHRQQRNAIFNELRNQNVAQQFGDALEWQQKIRQDKKLEGRD